MGLAERNTAADRVVGWALAAIVGVVAWHLVVILGMFADGLLHDCCPPDQVVSGLCMADWYDPAQDVLVIVFAGLSAVAVVLIPPLVTPSHRWKTALVAYGVGATFALVFAANSADVWAPAASALIAGAASILVARALWTQRPGDPTAGSAGSAQDPRT